MNTLTDIYDVLKAEGLVTTQSDFSLNWLGRSAHYMAQTGGDPEKCSLTSLKLLASRLELATMQAKEHSSRASYRRLRSAFVAATTIHNGVYELRHVPPYYRVTALFD